MTVSLQDAQLQLAELVSAALRGERVVIADNGKEIELVPVPLPPAERRTPVFGSMRGMFEVPDDFDAPLDDFAEYQ